MEITEKWIGKVAGWKANKAGRDLYRQGAVLSSSRKGHIVTGTLRSGGKPTRVTVKIHSPIDIDTVCPRLQCRRTGEICAHAVALMLDSISESLSIAPRNSSPPQNTLSSRQNQPAEKPSPPAEPVSVQLPPNFPTSLRGGQGGLSIRLIPCDATATQTDSALTQWLLENTGKSSPPMLGLRGAQALEFLRLLGSHPRVSMGQDGLSNSVSISTQGNRIPMQLQRDGDRISVSLTPSIAQNGSAWHTENHLYLWDSQQQHLLIHETSQLWLPRYWQRIADGSQAQLPIREFIRSIDQQNDSIIWDDSRTVLEIPISPATPHFSLSLDGNTSQLSATLRARYSAEIDIQIALNSTTDASFPIPDPDRENHYLSRNQDAENQAATTLMQAGFMPSNHSGAWQLSDEDAVIEFLTSTLPELRKIWSIRHSNTLKSITSNIVRIIPHYEIKEDAARPNSRLGSGQDWLAFDISFKTNEGKAVPREVIQRMLAAGKRSGTSKNGKQVIISSFDADTLESVLLDTDPRQENGIYYAQKSQAGYLHRLQAHYSGSGSLGKPDLSIVRQLPASIQSTLRPYQEEGIAWLYQRATEEGAALLADDMGLGKTLQTLSLIHLLKSNKRSASSEKPALSLVVCPTSLLGNWAEETEKFFPTLSTHIFHGSKRREKLITATSPDILITSYALIARDLAFFRSLEISTLVIDEASLIRNPDTQAAKALCQLKSQHRIALTGTPVENAVRDLWSLYAFLLPGYLGSRKDFQLRYEQALSNNQPDPHAMKRLRLRIEPFMLRRTKANVAKDLPPKLEQTIYCDASPSQRSTYAQLLHQGAEKVAQLEDGASRIQILTVLLRLRQAACDLRLIDPEMDISAEDASAKLTRLLELLTEAKSGGHRVLVFSQFTKMLGIIKAALAAAEISYAYLDGSTRDRSKEVARFQSPTGPDVFLISLKAGGYGLNLTAADTVIHFDPWWNPAVEAQATDRAHRIGQTKTTTVYKLVTRGTVEEKILDLQANKRNLINATISDDNAPLMQGLSAKEIASLLE